MPLYEYSCRSCGERFEVLRRMGAGSEGLSCPRCGSEEVAKQFSTFASAGAGSGLPCGAPSTASCGSGGFT
jgi:putative FmdB family regulatory protein